MYHYLSQEDWTAMGKTWIGNCKITVENQRHIVGPYSFLIANVTDPLMLVELLWFIATFSKKFDIQKE